MSNPIHVRFLSLSILLGLLLSIIGCKKDVILPIECDVVNENGNQGRDHIVVSFENGTTKGYNNLGDQQWILPINWDYAKVDNGILYGHNKFTVYMANPVTGELMDSIAIDRELSSTGIEIWNDKMIYYPAFDGSPCCELYIKDLLDNSPSELVGFYDQLHEKEVSGNYLFTREYGSTSMKVMDLLTMSEMQLPYFWLYYLPGGNHYYGTYHQDTMQFIRALNQSDLSIEWEMDVTGQDLGTAGKLDGNRLYFINRDFHGGSVQITILDVDDGTLIDKWQFPSRNLDNGWAYLLPTDELIVYEVNQFGWGGYLSRHDKCTGEETWGIQTGYGIFYAGSEALYNFGLGGLGLISKETGQYIGGLDLGDEPVSSTVIYSSQD